MQDIQSLPGTITYSLIHLSPLARVCYNRLINAMQDIQSLPLIRLSPLARVCCTHGAAINRLLPGTITYSLIRLSAERG